MKLLSDIRSSFLDYFQAQAHEVVPSSALVPNNDPTLLFTNAGMVQFKDVFTGKDKRTYKRATTSQKCVRAGGKHNDLDNVGYTTRHHTFFEMLGNFSFGDYFKEQAIVYAWDLITKHFALPKEKLCVTVYAEDDEAFALWQKVAGLSADKIIKIATMDNFWAMGDTGPCGPCSEIFYDHGVHIPGGPPGSADADLDRFTEIWNLVFMQYEQTPSERLHLPRPSIDTGMGLERIAAVLQGTHDNYATDLFKTLIQASVDLTGQKEPMHAHRVVADHIRATSFLIADGVMPSNEGRGYVLRRIMRRAMRHLYQLGVKKETVLWKLVSVLVAGMGPAYPELVRSQLLIENVIKGEEERFQQTLERGMRLLDTELQQSGAYLSGQTAFELYDTYGFPIDLTEDIVKEHRKTVDLESYTQCMQAQKQRSRAAWVGSGDVASEKVWYDIRDRLGVTEFVGYTHNRAQGKIQAIIKDGVEVDRAHDGDHVALVVNQTPFYAESGGQVGDTGCIISDTGSTIQIEDTQKYADGVFVHKGYVAKGLIQVDDNVELIIDEVRRQRLACNHSATHLLHHALRQVLGPHVTQKGSLVEASRLRFDFSHPVRLSDDEMAQVESLVNRNIQKTLMVHTEILTPDRAKASGAMALFNEKYGDLVRVVSMGESLELCGGTHTANTGAIGLFKIISEVSIASGIRRIEAITGEAILDYVKEKEQLTRQTQYEAEEAAKQQQKKMMILQKRLFKINADKDCQCFGDVKVYSQHVDDVESKIVQQVALEQIKTLASGILVLTSTYNDKVACVIAVTPDLSAQYDARDLAKRSAEILGGQGGGGKPELAQAGGSNPSAIPGLLAQLFG